MTVERAECWACHTVRMVVEVTDYSEGDGDTVFLCWECIRNKRAGGAGVQCVNPEDEQSHVAERIRESRLLSPACRKCGMFFLNDEDGGDGRPMCGDPELDRTICDGEQTEPRYRE